MLKNLTLAIITVLALAAITFADDQPTPKIPPSDAKSADALKSSPRHGEWVDVPIAGSDQKIQAWIVYPERKDKAPVVLVIHDIFGMSDWARAVTDQLAAEGFIAIAPDFLSGMGPNGGGSDSLGAGVGQAIRKLTPDQEMKILDAVRDYAVSQPSAADKSASLGFCWGGGISFAYATRQPKLKAAVVFYGTPPKNDALANIPCPILGLYGGDDNRVTSTVDDTVNAMASIKKEFSPHIYPGAGHGFMKQQDLRNGANLKAAQQSWAETLAFLKKNLQ